MLKGRFYEYHRQRRNRLRDLFSCLPAFLQNIAVTLYGYKQYRLRFGTILNSQYEAYFKQLNGKGPMQDALERLVQHAIQNVPFYRDCYAKKPFSIKGMTINDMQDTFPIITKKFVQDNIDSFISDTINKKHLVKLFTSGTTGTPAVFYCSRGERAINYAFYEKILTQFDVNYKSRSVTFAGRNIGGQSKSLIRNLDRYNNTLYLSSYKLNPENIALYINELNLYKPEFIDAYPSALTSLILLASEQGHTLNFKPKVVLVSSETLNDVDRQRIRSYFNAPIVDQYGSTEMVASMYSVDGAPYIVDPAYCLLEFNDNEGDAADLVSTGLFNYSMPMIRYSTGDVVRLNGEKNIVSIQGRKDDIIIGETGERVGRLDPVFKGVKNIKAAQIVQRKLGHIEVIIEENGTFDNKEEEKLICNLKDRLGRSIVISIKKVGNIPRTKNGKFRSVIGLSEFQ